MAHALAIYEVITTESFTPHTVGAGKCSHGYFSLRVCICIIFILYKAYMRYRTCLLDIRFIKSMSYQCFAILKFNVL